MLGGAIGRHDTRTAAVGEQCEAIAGGQAGGREQAHRREQFHVGLRPYHAAARQRTFEDGVVADHGARVAHRGARTGLVAPDFLHHHRLGARGGAQAADECAGVVYALDVHENAACLLVVQKIVEDFAEIEVSAGAQRYHAGKANAGAVGPIGQGGAHRAGLRHQGDMAGAGAMAREGRVQSDVRAHQTQAIGADHADAVGACNRGDACLEGATVGPGLAESRAQHQGVVNARARGVFEDAGHRLCRRDHNRQVDRLGQCGKARVARSAVKGGVRWIDRYHRACETAAAQVFQDGAAQRSGACAGTDEGNAGRGEQGLKVVIPGH